MKRLVVAALAVLALTGCSSSTADPEPTTEQSKNQAACDSFAELTTHLSEPFQADQVKEPWEELRDKFDLTALSAEGDVKSRMESLVSEWPNVADIVIYDTGRTKVNDHIKSIARACEAEGIKIEYGLFVV